MQVQFLGPEGPLEKEMATHSSILAWELPWTEEAGGLQPMGLPRVWHDWAHTHTHTHTHRDTHFPDAIHQKLLGWTAPTSHVNQSPSTTEKREVQNGEWKRRGVRMRGMVSYEGWGQVAQQVLTPSSLSCLTVFGGIASVKNFRQRNKDVESFALRVSWLIGWLSKAPTTLISPRFTGSWFKFPL